MSKPRHVILANDLRGYFGQCMHPMSRVFLEARTMGFMRSTVSFLYSADPDQMPDNRRSTPLSFFSARFCVGCII